MTTMNKRAVSLLDLPAQQKPLRAQLLKAIARVIDSGHYIMGPEVETFEKNVAAYCGAKHAVGVSSGSDALLVALMALGIGPGDEVVTSAYSFFATAGAISRVGAIPVFVDIDPETFNATAASIERVITPNTRAILPVHLFGLCAEMDPILRDARKRGIAVVEDAAQAIGALGRDGKSAGAAGQFGCLSFFPTKNLGGLGDAGMVLTNDDKLAAKARIMRSHGAEPKYYHHVIGGNFRIDALQAAALDVLLPKLEGWTKKRIQNADNYRKLFADAKIPDVILPPAPNLSGGAKTRHIYNQFVIRVPRRDELRRALAEQGIGSEVYYPVPLHLQECFKDLGFREGDFPEAERAAAESLAIPIHPMLTPADQKTVVDAIAAFYAA